MMYDQKTVRTLYKKLLTLYPRAFREQLAESMEQTFNDLCNERKQQPAQGLFGFVLWMFAETAIGIAREHMLRMKAGNMMKSITTNPRSAAIISFILALPFALLFTLLVLHIEPNFGPLRPLLINPDPDQPNVLGSLIVLGAFLLSLMAFIVNLTPIVRNVRAGNSITAYPSNVLLAIVILFFITGFVGGIIVDQYPCWIGVPNCD